MHVCAPLCTRVSLSEAKFLEEELLPQSFESPGQPRSLHHPEVPLAMLGVGGFLVAHSPALTLKCVLSAQRLPLSPYDVPGMVGDGELDRGEPCPYWGTPE